MGTLGPHARAADLRNKWNNFDRQIAARPEVGRYKMVWECGWMARGSKHVTTNKGGFLSAASFGPDRGRASEIMIDGVNEQTVNTVRVRRRIHIFVGKKKRTQLGWASTT